METCSKIYVAGHRGLVGAALVRALQSAGYSNLVMRTKEELNLIDRPAVDRFFASEKIEYVLLAAAKVGGILANSEYPATFLYENLAIQTNVIDSAYRHGVRKLLFLGSSCIYPKFAEQPIREESLLTGDLEPTNQWYAIAKIAGLKMCQAYAAQYGWKAISLMPTNLYGPNDNFSLTSSHVLPALIRKFDDAKKSGAKSVPLWGTGKPRREFLHVNDLAKACLFVMQNYDAPQPLNVGTGTDISIGDLAELIRTVVDVDVSIEYNPDKPDGTPRKLLDVSRIAKLGWKAGIDLETGLRDTYEWYLRNRETVSR